MMIVHPRLVRSLSLWHADLPVRELRPALKECLLSTLPEHQSDWPVTIESLCADFAALGVRPGMVLIVHSSLRSLGWVNGGPAAVILALEQVLTPEGTLVMP